MSGPKTKFSPKNVKKVGNQVNYKNKPSIKKGRFLTRPR